MKNVFYFNGSGLKLHRFFEINHDMPNKNACNDACDCKDCDHENEFEFDLFIWAILFNRLDMAKLFWMKGKVNYF